MADSGAPAGNQNASKGRIWREAIRKAVLRDNPPKIHALADKIVEKALDGDVAAMKEIGDRLDGKSTQAIDYTGNGSMIPSGIQVVFVQPAQLERVVQAEDAQLLHSGQDYNKVIESKG